MYRMNLIQPSRIAKLLLLPALALCGGGAPASSQTSEPEELFERKIRPLFDRHCMACHNSELATAGLDLSTAEGFRQGVSGSPLISAESPSQSRLLRAVRYQEAVKMPPAGKLDPPEIADLETWIRLGAPWPETFSRAGRRGGNQARGSGRPLVLAAGGRARAAAGGPPGLGKDPHRFDSFWPSWKSKAWNRRLRQTS